MRKFSAILVVMLILSSVSIYADEGVQYAYCSDTDIYIDYTLIDSYIIEEQNYISVEALRNYGFTVDYSPEEKAFYVHRNKFATPMMTKEMWDKRISERKKQKVVYGDFKVYLDSEWTKCFFIENGEVLIPFNSLEKYGEASQSGIGRYKGSSVNIFKIEMEAEFERAANVIEKNVDYGNLYKQPLYKGQMNEDGKPDGIGCMVIERDSLDKTTMVGYFKDGKPDGLIYIEWSRTVLKSYKMRRTYFIGSVDGSKTAPIREEPQKDGPNIVCVYRFPDGPNFGECLIPIHYINEWTGPDPSLDIKVYTEGCFYENWNDLNDGGGNQIISDSVIWKSGDIQTAEVVNYGQNIYKQPESKILSTDEFTLYENGIKTFYNGVLRSVGEDLDGDTILNREEDGKRLIPINIPVYVDGKQVKFDRVTIMENDRTLVPMRQMFDALGAKVDWDNDTNTATAKFDDSTIDFTIGETTAIINENPAYMDIPARLEENRTYIPLRFFAENFGYSVEWDDAIKTVTLSK